MTQQNEQEPATNESFPSRISINSLVVKSQDNVWWNISSQFLRLYRQVPQLNPTDVEKSKQEDEQVGNNRQEIDVNNLVIPLKRESNDTNFLEHYLYAHVRIQNQYLPEKLYLCDYSNFNIFQGVLTPDYDLALDFIKTHDKSLLENMIIKYIETRFKELLKINPIFAIDSAQRLARYVRKLSYDTIAQFQMEDDYSKQIDQNDLSNDFSFNHYFNEVELLLNARNALVLATLDFKDFITYRICLHRFIELYSSFINLILAVGTNKDTIYNLIMMTLHEEQTIATQKPSDEGGNDMTPEQVGLVNEYFDDLRTATARLINI